MILAESYSELMLDPAHMAFELTWEAITALVAFLVLRPITKRLARKFHRDMDRSHGIAHVTVEHVVPLNRALTPAEADAAAIHIDLTDEWVDA